MNNIIRKLLYERGELSLTRSLAVAGFLSFLIGSFYLMYKGISWGNYETFATMTGGGGMATQIANKFIMQKYSSEPSKPFVKGEPPTQG